MRSDELEQSWKIFSPLLDEIEALGVVPDPYVFGSRGPARGDQALAELGYVRNIAYTWTK